MKAMQRIISAGFATAALAIAFLPAASGAVWPYVDFEWYDNLGKPAAGTVDSDPAPREGHIWAPGHYVFNVDHQVLIRGQWIKDERAQQDGLRGREAGPSAPE
jgi:hypothetical protein